MYDKLSKFFLHNQKCHCQYLSMGDKVFHVDCFLLQFLYFRHVGETVFLYPSETDPKIQFSNLGIVIDFRHKHNVYNIYFSCQMVLLKIYIPIFFLG